MKTISENCVRELINELKEENYKRSKMINATKLHGHATVLTHAYNVTIKHISKLEKLIKCHD
jgi:hypothetical protein